MATITPASPAGPHTAYRTKGPSFDRLPGAAVALAASGLIWVCGAEFVQSQNRIPANRFFETHQERFQSATDGGKSLEKALQHYRQLPMSARGAQEWRRLGGLLLMAEKRGPRTNDSPFPPTEDELRAALVASLAREPAHPLTWAYLADAELTFGGDKVKALQDLEQSYQVAPLEPDFFIYRLWLALECSRQWTPTFLRHLRHDIESLFPEQGQNRNRQRFVQLARSSSELRALTGTLLKDDPAAFARYQKALQQQR